MKPCMSDLPDRDDPPDGFVVDEWTPFDEPIEDNGNTKSKGLQE
jgi:hypothetical protein